MGLFNCECCSYLTNVKCNYSRHLKSNKHLHNIDSSLSAMVMTTNDHKMTTNDHKMTTNDHKMTTNDHKKSLKIDKNIELIRCDYCSKSFSTLPHKRRHEHHYCKNNDNKQKLLNDKEKKIKKLEKQVDTLIKKAGNTTNITQNNQQNIKLNNYGSEDLSHITDFFKNNLLKAPHGMIPKMIEAVHFNENKPENKNVMLPNKKENKVKIFSGDKWVYKDKNETVNDLIDGKYFIMDTYYENICNNKDTNLNLYKRFQRLFDERNKLLLEAQKKECELVLLNNR